MSVLQPTMQFSKSKQLNAFGIDHFHFQSQPSLIREVPTAEYVTNQIEGNDQHFHVSLFITLFTSPQIKL